MTDTLAGTPFCHVFRHGERHLVYDVGTSRLLSVAPAVAAALREPEASSRADLAARLGPRFPAETVTAALDAIETARARDGLFGTMRPQPADAALTPPEIDALATRRRLLTLSVTENCNLRCRYCPHTTGAAGARPHRSRRMPLRRALDAVTDFLDHATATDHPAIAFYGGEPLVALDLIAAVVRAVRDRPDGSRVRLVVDTNGVGLARPEVRELILRERLALQVSLDGSADVHDRYRRDRRGRPTHAVVQGALTSLLRADPSVADRLAFAVTLTPPLDLASLDAWFDDLPCFRAAGIGRRPVVRANLASLVGTELGAGAGPAELRRQWQRERAAARARYLAACAAGQHDRLPPVTAALFDDDLIAWHHRASGPPHSGVRGGCCLPGVRRTHVQVDGRLQPCERVSEDLVIGAAGTGPQPGRIEAVRARFRAAVGRRCVNCWAVRFCDVCYPALEGHGGGIPAARCQAVRRHAGDLLRLVADLRAAGPQALSWLEDTTVD